MARETIKDLKARIQQLEEEKRVAQQGSTGSTLTDRISQEIKLLKKVGFNDAGKIKVKPIDDHRNVVLYHTNGVQVGKFVGPLHIKNAELEIQRWAEKGIMLSARKPTEEEIKLYKETAEYKRLEEAFKKGRAKKIKTRRSGEIEKIAEAIAKASGKPVVNTIKSSPQG